MMISTVNFPAGMFISVFLLTTSKNIIWLTKPPDLLDNYEIQTSVRNQDFL